MAAKEVDDATRLLVEEGEEDERTDDVFDIEEDDDQEDRDGDDELQGTPQNLNSISDRNSSSTRINLWTSQHNPSAVQNRNAYQTFTISTSVRTPVEHKPSQTEEDSNRPVFSTGERRSLLRKKRNERPKTVSMCSDDELVEHRRRRRFDSAATGSMILRGSFVSVLGEERTGDNLITATQCLMHLLKSMIGTGLLALPYAFSIAGIAGGPLFMAIICLIALVAMNFLVDANKHMCKLEDREYMDYGDLAECALKHGPFRFLSDRCHWGKNLVNVLLILTQLGFCAIYFVFLASTVQFVMKDFEASIEINSRILIAIFLLPIVLLSLIRSLAFLALFSMLANVLLVVGLGMIVSELFKDIPSPSELPLFGAPAKIPLFFGSAIFAVEGIGLVLPLENKMQKPEQFKPVLNGGMLFVFGLYLVFGFLGYNKYHEHIQSSISLNLPHQWYYAATKIIFGVAMYVTYALQFMVPVRILMPWVNRTFTRGNQYIRESCFRAFLVLITFAAAILIPYLNLFIELLGSVASSSLALSLPAIIYEFSMTTNRKMSLFSKVVSRIFVVILLCFGLVGGFMGTTLALQNIVEAITSPTGPCPVNPSTVKPVPINGSMEYPL